MLRASVYPAIGLLIALSSGPVGCESGRARTPSGPGGPTADGGVSARDSGVTSGPCATGADCALGVCDRGLGRCVACRTTDECGAGERCEAGRCLAAATCDSDLTCTPMGQVCDAVGQRCVACNSAADCPGGPCLGHSCLDNPACTSSLECADLRMVCAEARPPAWPESYNGQGCAECAGSPDCAGTEACRGGFCVDVCAGRICGSVEGAECGTCAGGGICAPDGRACLTILPAQFDGEQIEAVGGTALVWVDGRSSGAARVWSVDLAGTGEARQIYRGQGGLPYLDGVAFAGGRVFAALTDGSLLSGEPQGSLTRFADVPGVGSSTSVWCQGLAGHAAFVVCDLVDYDEVVTSGLYRIPVDGAAPALIDTIVQPSGFFVDGEDVAWSDFNNAQIGKSGLLSGQRTVLDRVQADLYGVMGGYAFYRTTEGELRRVSLGGGAPEPLTVNPRDWRLVGLASDRIFLLERFAQDLVIYAADLDGRNLRELLTVTGGLPADPNAPLRIHPHEGALYLIGGQVVVRVTY